MFSVEVTERTVNTGDGKGTQVLRILIFMENAKMTEILQNIIFKCFNYMVLKNLSTSEKHQIFGPREKKSLQINKISNNWNFEQVEEIYEINEKLTDTETASNKGEPQKSERLL